MSPPLRDGWVTSTRGMPAQFPWAHLGQNPKSRRSQPGPAEPQPGERRIPHTVLSQRHIETTPPILHPIFLCRLAAIAVTTAITDCAGSITAHSHRGQMF
jgi:hypothetical protein